MSERSEPKQVCRRNALTFLGYAAVFGLMASPAILAVSEAEAQTTTRPPRPRRRPQTRRCLGQSAVRSGEAGEQKGARNAGPDAQNGVKTGAQDATSDGTRATAPRPLQPPPSRKSSPFIRANHGNRAAAQAREGRTARADRRATAWGAPRSSGRSSGLSFPNSNSRPTAGCETRA